MSNRREWSEEEDKKWTDELNERLSTDKCPACGSNKLTKHLMGRPYMAFVEFHKAKSEELGWQTLALGGCCAGEGMPDTTCTACQATEGSK